MNIILTGFRGSGKTVVGRELARRLDWHFIDTDEEIEHASGTTIARLFETGGEARFRELEREHVLKACLLDRHVIAVGGGAVENAELAGAMKEAGLVILLVAPAEVLHERITRDSNSAARRPPLTDKEGLAEVRELLARRRDAYRETAHLEIDTATMEPEHVAEAIVARLSSGEPGGKFSEITT